MWERILPKCSCLEVREVVLEDEAYVDKAVFRVLDEAAFIPLMSKMLLAAGSAGDSFGFEAQKSFHLSPEDGPKRVVFSWVFLAWGDLAEAERVFQGVLEGLPKKPRAAKPSSRILPKRRPADTDEDEGEAINARVQPAGHMRLREVRRETRDGVEHVTRRLPLSHVRSLEWPSPSSRKHLNDGKFGASVADSNGTFAFSKDDL